jgi:hypothetical protein
MGTLLSIVDGVVLLVLILLVPRTVLRGLPKGAASMLLAIGVAVFTIIFAVVSFTASVGFLNSGLAQLLWLVVLLAMAYIVRLSWANAPAAE